MKARAPANQSFFLPGECQDPGYRNVRDNPNRPEVRAFVESLWSQYRDLADPNCRTNAQNDFLARFWEMYLAVTLRERGFNLERYGNKGPEFYFLHNHRKVWVEAVAPHPGIGEDRVPDDPNNEVTERPTEKILLRYTHALDKKRGKYNEALKKIIEPDDLFLLAINSSKITRAPFSNGIPDFVKAFLPIGNLAALMDNRTGEIVDTYYQRRENIEKKSGEGVPTDAFLDPAFSFVSALLHSEVDCVNHPQILGEDFNVLHNPTALHPLDPSIFQWCEQMFYQGGELKRRQPEKNFQR